MEHNCPPGTRNKKRGLIVEKEIVCCMVTNCRYIGITLYYWFFGINYRVKNLNIYIIFIQFQYYYRYLLFNYFYYLIKNKILACVFIYIKIYHAFLATTKEENSSVLKPGPAGRPGTRPARGWNRTGLMKKLHKPWPGVTRLTGKTRSKTRLQPVDFCFFFY